MIFRLSAYDSEGLQEVSRNTLDPGAGRPRRVPEAFLC